MDTKFLSLEALLMEVLEAKQDYEIAFYKFGGKNGESLQKKNYVVFQFWQLAWGFTQNQIELLKKLSDTLFLIEDKNCIDGANNDLLELMKLIDLKIKYYELKNKLFSNLV